MLYLSIWREIICTFIWLDKHQFWMYLQTGLAFNSDIFCNKLEETKDIQKNTSILKTCAVKSIIFFKKWISHKSWNKYK